MTPASATAAGAPRQGAPAAAPDAGAPVEEPAPAFTHAPSAAPVAAVEALAPEPPAFAREHRPAGAPAEHDLTARSRLLAGRVERLLVGGGVRDRWLWVGPILSAIVSATAIWIAMEDLAFYIKLPVALLAAATIGTISAGYLASDEPDDHEA